MQALVFNLSLPRALSLMLLGPLYPRLYYKGRLAMLRLAEVEEPAVPAPDWVKIRTRLCGYCGSDLNIMLLRDSPMATPFTSFPAVIGHEVCGEVVEIGGQVSACRPGDLVAVDPMLGCAPRGISAQCRPCRSGRPANCENLAEGKLAPGMFMGVCRDLGGGFAEYMVAHESQIFPVPQGVSAESAMLTEPLSVGLQAVLDNRPADTDKVLIIGGGVIGTMVVKSIRALGLPCDITVMEPNPFAAEFVKRSGADQVMAGSILEAARKITGARLYKPLMGKPILQGGFNRVFDTVGHSSTLQDALIASGYGGFISLVGISKKVAFDPTPLWLKLLTIKGVYANGYTMTADGPKHTFALALELLRDRKIVVEDMLTHVFPIDRYQDMIQVNLAKGKHRAIKTAVRFEA